MTAKCHACSADVVGTPAKCSSCGAEHSDPGSQTLLLEDHPITAPDAEALLEFVRRELAGEYEVEAEIGRGGMAVVYRARDVELGRLVALKVLPPELALGASMVDRFKREARMAASLEHANIIPVYRVGHTGRLLFIAMKLIEGRGLDAILRTQGALPVPVVQRILSGAVAALAHAHENGIVHRDVKAANILIDSEGRVVVSDFGVARALEDASLTMSGSLIGTPYYMSPEQCAGKNALPQSDQYSMGVVAFQMLTGTVPFEGDTIAAVMHHHFFTPVPNLLAARSDAPRQLVDVILRALAKGAKQRYGTTGEMHRAVESVEIADHERAWGDEMLRSIASGMSIPRVRTAPLPKLREAIRLSGPNVVIADTGSGPRRRRLLPAAAVAGIVLIAAGAYSVGTRDVDSPPAGSAALSTGTAVRQAEAAEAPETAPQPSAPRQGQIRFEGLPPRASVAVNGTILPEATIRRGGDLVPGTYRFVMLADGFQEEQGEFEVRAGQQTVVPVRPVPLPPPPPPPPPGTLRLRAWPTDARILIDDQEIGVGVVYGTEVAAGARRLRVAAEGFESFDTTIVVLPNESTDLRPIELRGRRP